MNLVNIETVGRVVTVTINRPDALNALNSEIMHRVLNTLQNLDRSLDVGCFVLTGTGKAFAAGADISELANHDYSSMASGDILGAWQTFAQMRTPKIAAVSGYALGGGCELAMMCDFIYASETAKFGQPEIKLGLIPGMGGSQRLTRLIGRVKAMEMILTGRMMNATEAEHSGLVARIFKEDALMEETLKSAQMIAGYGKIASMTARDAVNMADETGISPGLLFERRAYHALWATTDAREGMNAFLQKRDPMFNV